MAFKHEKFLFYLDTVFKHSDHSLIFTSVVRSTITIKMQQFTKTALIVNMYIY